MIGRAVRFIRSMQAPNVVGTTDADLVRIAYKGILGREAEPGAVENWAPRFTTLPKEDVLRMLLESREFQQNYIHKRVQREGHDAIASISNRMALSVLPKPLHAERVRLIKEHLPVAEKVLDLGGASGTQQGALIDMGYRGAEQITIIDLPADIRFKSAMETQRESSHYGTTVKYEYHSMADLSRYPDESFDFIWSGQTMEHISLGEGDRVFEHVPRILKPGGIFALDTPNRTLTRLAVGDDGFIHAEHAHEYRYEEMRDRHAKCGLNLIEAKGITDLPRSLKLGYLVPDEIASGQINDTPETSFVFFLKYQKS